MFPVFEHFLYGKDLYEKMVAPVYRAFDLTYTEFTVLLFLANNPQYDTAAQVAKVRRLAKSHVSVSLRTLTERGLITGEYFPGNQKTLHLRLTPEAEPVVTAGQAAQKAFGAKLLKDFTPEEVETLRKLAEKLHRNMKQEDENHAGE